MIPFSRIGIFGLGLMGGSLAGALADARARGAFAGRVTGHARKEETRRLALDSGWFDAVTGDAPTAAKDCDLLVFCAPVTRIPPLVEECLPGLASDAVLTDVGSTKTWLAEAVPSVLVKNGHTAIYVPAHPMCGSEKSGFSAGRPDLYQSAKCAICPTASPEAVRRVAQFWQGVGCSVVEMGAADHDRWVGKTSHLPLLMASVLAHTVGEGEVPAGMRALVGRGFRDTSRLAEGDRQMWTDIAKTNREALLQAMCAFRRNFEALHHAIQNGDESEQSWRAFGDFLSEGAERRHALAPPEPDSGKTA